MLTCSQMAFCSSTIPLPRFRDSQSSAHRRRRESAVCSAAENKRGHSTNNTAKNVKEDIRRAAQRDLSHLNMPSFASKLKNQPLLNRTSTTLQINIGLTCNLACRHCHVESSPSRTETMSRPVADRIIALTRNEPLIQTVDITGGAPEMHEQFRYLVTTFRAMGLHVIDRCNLSVLKLPGYEDLASFLASNNVKVIASMPCYTAKNVEKQRGNGVFDASIEALQMLNLVGYGIPGSGLELDLVYNPVGATLPPAQQTLEEDYRRELRKAFNVQFSSLICITNMPIKRFADDLRRSNKLEEYMQLLVSKFNPATLDSVMCRDMIHVDHDGRLHDCDFNFALGMGMVISKKHEEDGETVGVRKESPSVFNISSWAELVGRSVQTGLHCYGCTAGSGSSCVGTLV